jgi:HEAT repeat protein
VDKCALLLPSLLSAVAVCQSPPVGETPAAIDDHCRAILSQALKDGNPDTRKEAVLALSLLPTSGPFLSQLESMLDDKDVEVRLATVSVLLDLKGKRATTILHKALNDPVPEVSFSAAQALFRRHDPSGRDVLVAVLNGNTKTASGFVTKEIRDASRMLHTPRTTLLYALRQGVGFAPVPGLGQGIASLEGLLSHPDTSGRATAALLLEHDKDERTVGALRTALEDKDWSVRAAAVHSLALRSDRASGPEFMRLLNDKAQAVRLRAAAGLLRFNAIRKAGRKVDRQLG